jgi:hypothetical protein
MVQLKKRIGCYGLALQHLPKSVSHSVVKSFMLSFFVGGGHFQYPDHIVLNGRMIDEKSVGRDLEGIGQVLIRVPSWRMPLWAKQHHK